jgi:hypothetical protein
VKLLRIFSAWRKCVFAGGFAEIGVLDVVFCGQGVVECVAKMGCGCAVFGGRKLCSFCGFIFEAMEASQRLSKNYGL